MRRNTIVIVAVLGCISLIYIYMYTNPFKGEKNVFIDISHGASANTIGRQLEKSGLISNQGLFKLLLKVSRQSKNLKAGIYRFKISDGYFKILKKLISGSDVFVTVTIPEGFTTEQIALRLQSKNIISDSEAFVNLVIQKDLRGFLFPETYNISRNQTAEQIIDIMYAHFNKIFTQDFKSRTKEMGFTVREIITLASIIEKEAKISEERPVISDIFHKRLKKRIYLESCASVLFALGEHKKRLLYEDLEIDSPYNTYRHFGLPPSPISNPGLDSIRAALYPKATNYLYFFARGDKGAHVFSATYEEHLNRQRRLK